MQRPVALLASPAGTIVEVADDGSILRQVELAAAARWPESRGNEEGSESSARRIWTWVWGAVLTKPADRLALLVTAEEMTEDGLDSRVRSNWLVSVRYRDFSVEDVVELSRDRLYLFGIDGSNRIVLADLPWTDEGVLDRAGSPEVSLWSPAPLRLETRVELSPEDVATLSKWASIDRRLEVRSEGIFKAARTGGILLPPGHRLRAPELSASATARVHAMFDPMLKVNSGRWPLALDRQTRAGVRLAAMPSKLFEMKDKSPIVAFVYREADGELVDDPRTWNPSKVYLIPDGSGYFVLESEPTDGKIRLHRALFGMGRDSLVELEPDLLVPDSNDWNMEEPCTATDGAWLLFRGANFESVFVRWQDGLVARVPFQALARLCMPVPTDRR